MAADDVTETPDALPPNAETPPATPPSDASASDAAPEVRTPETAPAADTDPAASPVGADETDESGAAAVSEDAESAASADTFPAGDAMAPDEAPETPPSSDAAAPSDTSAPHAASEPASPPTSEPGEGAAADPGSEDGSDTPPDDDPAADVLVADTGVPSVEATPDDTDAPGIEAMPESDAVPDDATATEAAAPAGPATRRERPPRTAPHSPHGRRERGEGEGRPREVLVVALGETGPGTGAYARLDAADSEPVEARWSGGAILALYGGRFSQVHVVGTEPALAALAAALGVGAGEGEVAARIARSVGEAPGVRAACHVVPAPASDLAATLAVLGRVAATAPDARVSLDATAAGVPLALAAFAALLHADALGDRLGIGSVFCADAASDDAPRRLVDLGAAADLVRWSVAAERLRATGTSAGVARLLGDDDALGALAARFDAATQGATGASLRDDARAFADALDARPRGDVGFDLVRSALRDLPREIAEAASDTDALLALALRHLRQRRFAAAAVVGWEAVVGRVGQALGATSGQRDRTVAIAQHLLPEARVLFRLSREATQGRAAASADTPRRTGGMLGGILSSLRTALATADFDARVAAAAAERTPRPAPARPGPPRSGPRPAPRPDGPDRGRPAGAADGPRPPRPDRSGAPDTPRDERAERPRDERPDRPQGRGPRPDGARPDGARPDGPRPQGPRPEGGRRDGPRPEGGRADGPRTEGPRPDGGRRDGPRPEGPRPDGPRRDGPRPPRGDRPDGAGRPERADRPDGSRPDGPRPSRDTIADALPEDVRNRLLGLKR